MAGISILAFDKVHHSILRVHDHKRKPPSKNKQTCQNKWKREIRMNGTKKMKLLSRKELVNTFDVIRSHVIEKILLQLAIFTEEV